MLLQHGTKDQNEVFGEGGGSKRNVTCRYFICNVNDDSYSYC